MDQEKKTGWFARIKDSIMKLTATEDQRIEANKERRHQKYMEIYDAWTQTRNEPHAVDRLAEKFSVNKTTVLNAISYGLKYGEGGCFERK